MSKYICTVCGYIHEGKEPPEKCPNCGAPKEKFTTFKEEDSSIHIGTGSKMSYGSKPEVNPFFGDYESLACFIYNLPVGQGIPLHKHPTTDELFYVIKGRIKFIIGDKEMTAVPGDVLQGKMNIPHTFTNAGDEPAAFLSVKGPKPVDTVMIDKEDK